MTRYLAPLLAMAAVPAAAQVNTPAPATAATPAPIDPALNLSAKEKSTLTRCMRMTEAERAQSSRCSAVMVKAGKADPASKRPANPNVVVD